MAKQVQEDSQLEYDNLRIEYIFPVNSLSKSKLKQLKILSRDREGCQLVCSACSKGLRSLHAAHSHVSNETHKTKVKEKWLDLLLPELPPQPLAPNHLQALDHFVESSFREQSASVQGQGEARTGIATELQGLVQQTFPDVTVELFGSTVSGFALVSSNVNLNLNIPGAQEKQVLIPPVMKGLLEIIRCNVETYCEVQDDFFAFNKIPRILFTHKASGLKCEIRAVVGNPMALSHLLGLYGSLDERALKLAVLFRYWAKVCKVDQQEDGHYPGHMFIVMVIHYLQQRNPQALPVLHELKNPAEDSDSTDNGDKRLDPTEVCYLDDRSAILEKWQCCNTETVGELWYGLLRYYTLEFKMSLHAVTIRQLVPLLRSERQWGGTRLTVEDPLIPRSNLGRAASCEKVFSYMMSSLKQTLLYFWNFTSVDLFSKDNISRLLAQQEDRRTEGEVAKEKVTSGAQEEVHCVRKKDTEPKIPDNTMPARAEATSPHETQLVGQSGIGGEAKHSSKPDGIEVNKSQESALEGKMQQAACDTSLLKFKPVKEYTDSTALEAQAQQSTNTPEVSLKRLATKERSESTSDTSTPAEAEATSPHKTQLVGQRGIDGEAVHFSTPDGIEANNSQESNLEGKMQQAACEASVLSSKSVKGCTNVVGLEAQAQHNAIHVKPNTPETSVKRFATKEKSESSTAQSDNSIVFAAFSRKECPTVAANTKPNEFEISFLNDSLLSQQSDDHKEGDLKHEPQVPTTKGLPPDLKFGSFSDESNGGEGEKAVEEVDVVPTNEQRDTQQTVNDATDPQLQPSLQENVNSSLHKENFHSSLHIKNVDSSLHTQSTCVNHETDSSDTKLCGIDKNVSMSREMTGTSQSTESSKSSSGVESTPKPMLSDSLLPTTAATHYSFHISNFVFHPYPKACLNCKRLNHIAVECQTDDLPELMMLVPRHGPGQHSLEMMGSAFKTHMDSVIPRPSHFKMREDMCDYILADIKKIYPNARLQLFGSSANGFGSFKSDLDICMTLEGDTEFESSSVIQAVAEELHKHKGKYQYILPITHARVPIVKFYLTKWKLQCDISLENQLALRNTKMLAAYASIDERVQLLGYALKHLAKVCDMGDASTGSLSSYAYILLLLHYLQRTHPPVVPVLQELSAGDTGRHAGPYIHTWNCYYYEFQSKEELIKVWPYYHKNMLSVGELWLGFLRYFLRFDWTTKVVAIRQMDPVTKFDKWWMSKCMCIEDPFNLEHNLAAGITGKMKTYILERFSAALSYHSENILWKCMRHMMDEEALIGDSRSPKFIVCILCNARGHKAQQCPLKRKKPKPKLQPEKQEVEKMTKEAAGSTISSPPMTVQTSKPRGGILRIPLKTKGDLSQRSEQLPKRGDINKESRNTKKRQISARVPKVGQEPHPQVVSIVTPHSGFSSVISPHGDHSSVIAPHSGFSSVVPPHSGHSSVFTPHSGTSSVISPHSGHSSVITTHSGHPSNAIRLSPPPSMSATSRPFQAVYTRSPFPDPRHATPFRPLPYSASPPGPQSPHAHPSVLQNWHSPAFSPLQPTHSASPPGPQSPHAHPSVLQNWHSPAFSPLQPTHSASPTTPTGPQSPHAHPSVLQNWHSPAFSPLQPTHSASLTTPTGPQSPHAHPSILQEWHSPAFSLLQPTQQMTNRDFGPHQSVPSPPIQAHPAQVFPQFLYNNVPLPGAGSPSSFQPTPETHIQFPQPPPTHPPHSAGNRSHGDHDRHAMARHSNTGQMYPK